MAPPDANELWGPPVAPAIEVERVAIERPVLAVCGRAFFALDYEMDAPEDSARPDDVPPRGAIFPLTLNGIVFYNVVRAGCNFRRVTPPLVV